MIILLKLVACVLLYAIGFVATLLWFRPWNGVLEQGSTVVSKDGVPLQNEMIEKWAVRGIYALAGLWPVVVPFLIVIRILVGVLWLLGHLFPKLRAKAKAAVLKDFDIKDETEDP